VFSFFKTKTKTIDEGIRATIDMEDAMFQSFKEIEKSRFFGLSKKRRTTFSEMSGEQSEPFQDAVFGIRESVIGATESLGVSIDVFDGFSHKFELSLKGLDEAARQAAITEEFTRMGDSLANLVPHITSMNELFAVAANRVALTDRLLQAQGKTEELTARIRDREMDATNKLNKARLAQVFAAEDAAIAAENAAIAADALGEVNGWMGKFRLSLYDVSLAGAEAASAFVDLFGSLENFNAVSQSYYQNFYTDAERIARETELLSIEMLALGIDTLPSTRAAFRALVDEADALGDSGLVASLMQLSPAFAEITAGADALGDSLRALVNEDLFATGQDYTRALSRGSNSQTFTLQQSDAELRAEMRALNVSMERLVSSSEITAGNTGRGADTADDTLAFQLEQTL
jgi:hypothetical protein